MNETRSQKHHTIGFEMGLELRPQDRRNRIRDPIEKKDTKVTTTANQTRAPHFTSMRCARGLCTQLLLRNILHTYSTSVLRASALIVSIQQ